MTEWITIDLPWDSDFSEAETIILENSRLAYIELEAQASKIFGSTVEESREQMLKVVGGVKVFDSLRESIPELQEDYFTDDWHSRICELYQINNPAVVEIARHWILREKIDAWIIEEAKRLGIADNQKAALALVPSCFSRHPLCHSGVLIEVEEDSLIAQYLIGDINPLAGACDDCRAFNRDAMVLRAKLVLEATQGLYESVL